MSGFCSAHKHHEPGCRQCGTDNELMYVSDFRCPKCGNTFEDIWHMDLIDLNCPYCGTVLEKVDGKFEKQD